MFVLKDNEKAASSGSGVEIDGDEATTTNGSEYGIGLINKRTSSTTSKFENSSFQLEEIHSSKNEHRRNSPTFSRNSFYLICLVAMVMFSILFCAVSTVNYNR